MDSTLSNYPSYFMACFGHTYTPSSRRSEVAPNAHCSEIPELRIQRDKVETRDLDCTELKWTISEYFEKPSDSNQTSGLDNQCRTW
jgi:hypothetical protein